MIPSKPVIMPKVALPVKSLAVSKKKSIAKLANTNCRARFFLKVPKNIAKVKKPHIKKYAAIAVSEGEFTPAKMEVLGRSIRNTRDHQKSP